MCASILLIVCEITFKITKLIPALFYCLCRCGDIFMICDKNNLDEILVRTVEASWRMDQEFLVFMVTKSNTIQFSWGLVWP